MSDSHNKPILAVCMATCLVSSSYASSSELNTKSLRKIQVRQVEPFNLGILAMDSRYPGTLAVSPEGKIKSSRIHLVNRVDSQLLSVCGEPNQAFSISIPEQVYIKQNGNTIAMVSSFTNDLSSNSSIHWQSVIPRSGCRTISIGADIQWFNNFSTGHITADYSIEAQYIMD